MTQLAEAPKYTSPKTETHKIPIRFNTGFTNESPHPAYNQARANMDSIVEGMARMNPELPLQALGPKAMGDIARQEGLRFVHGGFYETTLQELEASGALAVRDSHAVELGHASGLQWAISEIAPQSLEGVDRDASMIGFAKRVHQLFGLTGYVAIEGDETFKSRRNPDLAIAVMTTQYVGAEGTFKFGTQAGVFTSSDLIHTESEVDSSLLTKDGQLKPGTAVPVSSSIPGLKTGFVYEIQGEGEKLDEDLTIYPVGVKYDEGMYTDRLTVTHRSRHTYNSVVGLVIDQGQSSILPWVLRARDEEDPEAKKIARGINWLTREMFKKQDYNANANPTLAALVLEDPSLRAVVQYSTVPDRGVAMTMALAGVLRRYHDSDIKELLEAGKLDRIVGDNKSFASPEALKETIFNPTAWTPRVSMHSPWPHTVTIFQEPSAYRKLVDFLS